MRTGTKQIAALVVSVAFAGVAIADTRLTMEEHTVVAQMSGDGPPNETKSEYTLWLREDRAARVTDKGRMVARLDRGESYFIDDVHRTTNVVALDGLPENLQAPPEIRKTGETRMIGRWNAERYDLALPSAPDESATIVLWISDIGVDMDAYRAFSKSVDGGQGLMTAIANLPGYPVLQETDFGFVKATTRLMDVSEDTPPAGTYEAPADYTRKD